MDQLLSLVAPQLDALDVLARHDGHMTRAANALGVPQSSMSRRIHALEKTLGVVLLVTDGRLVRLTPAALALVDRIRGPLSELDTALTDVTSGDDPVRGTVRFGFPLTMGTGAVPDMLAEFHRLHPAIRLHLKQAHGSELSKDLATGILDVALVIPPPHGIDHLVLGDQRIAALLPADHALTQRESVHLAELGDETFIVCPESYHLRTMVETWCRESGFTPSIGVEITEFDTIRELVGRGLGVSLLPYAEQPTPNTSQIALDGGTYRREISLAWGPTSRTPAGRLLRSFIADQALPATQ